MKKFTAILILAAAILSLASCKDTKKENISSSGSELLSSDAADNDNIEFNAADYVIEFDEQLLGEAYKEAGNEIKDCTYTLSFKDGKFGAYMNFGNSIEGTYTVSDDNIISCKLSSASGEYSPPQEIEGAISFKVISKDTIKVVSAPKSYTVKISELSDGEWVLSSEEKELEFWPLVDGIKFRLAKEE